MANLLLLPDPATVIKFLTDTLVTIDKEHLSYRQEHDKRHAKANKLDNYKFADIHFLRLVCKKRRSYNQSIRDDTPHFEAIRHIIMKEWLSPPTHKEAEKVGYDPAIMIADLRAALWNDIQLNISKLMHDTSSVHTAVTKIHAELMVLPAWDKARYDLDQSKLMLRNIRRWFESHDNKAGAFVSAQTETTVNDMLDSMNAIDKLCDHKRPRLD
jgi:hypothetical protein